MLSELEVLSPVALLYDIVHPVPSSANLWAMSHYKHYMGTLPWLNAETLTRVPNPRFGMGALSRDYSTIYIPACRPLGVY